MHHSCVMHSGRSSLIDRKSTRLNSSHGSISYAVFCLKKNTQYSPFKIVLVPEQPPNDGIVVNIKISRDLSDATTFDNPRLCFFFNDTATTEIYTLSLHDALPI